MLQRWISWLAFLGPLALYVASLNAGVGFWDTGEAQTVPAILGIFHPTGFPAFALLGWLFVHAFPVGAVAWRLSLFSAIAMSIAAWSIYAVLRLQQVQALLACAAAWTFASGAVAWSRGTRAEVHALLLAFVGLGMVAAFAARRTTSPLPLLGAAFAFGCAAATHPLALYALPSALIVLTLRRVTRAEMLRSAIAFCLPLLAYAYMPLRSAIVYAQRRDPTLALGLPPGRPFWDYGHPSTLQGFVWMLSGTQFDKGSAPYAFLDFGRYASMYSEFASKWISELGLVAFVLSVVGIIVAFRYRDRSALALLALIALIVPLALTYKVEIDYDRYLLLPYWALCVFAGLGACRLAQLGKEKIRRAMMALVAAAFAVGIAFNVVSSRALFAQRNSDPGGAFIDRMLARTPNGAIIVTPWMYATPLAYASYVEHRFGSRIIETAEPEDIADRIVAWAKTRPVYAVYYRFNPLRIPDAFVERVGNNFPPLYRIVPTRRS